MAVRAANSRMMRRGLRNSPVRHSVLLISLACALSCSAERDDAGAGELSPSTTLPEPSGSSDGDSGGDSGSTTEDEPTIPPGAIYGACHDVFDCDGRADGDPVVCVAGTCTWTKLGPPLDCPVLEGWSTTSQLGLATSLLCAVVADDGHACPSGMTPVHWVGTYQDPSYDFDLTTCWWDTSQLASGYVCDLGRSCGDGYVCTEAAWLGVPSVCVSEG